MWSRIRGMPEPTREIVVRRAVFEAAQDVEKRLPEIEGTFERTFEDWGWNAAYARRQWMAYEAEGNENLTQLWRAVEDFFKEREVLDAGTPVRIIED